MNWHNSKNIYFQKNIICMILIITMNTLHTYNIYIAHIIIDEYIVNTSVSNQITYLIFWGKVS